MDWKNDNSNSNQTSSGWIRILKSDFGLIGLNIWIFSFEPISWAASSSYKNKHRNEVSMLNCLNSFSFFNHPNKVFMQMTKLSSMKYNRDINKTDKN